MPVPHALGRPPRAAPGPAPRRRVAAAVVAALLCLLAAVPARAQEADAMPFLPFEEQRREDLPPVLPALTLAELFDALDPAHPDSRVRAVRDLAAAGDTDAAAAAYLAYRRALHPRHPLRDPAAEDADPVLNARAATVSARLLDDGVLIPFFPGWTEAPVSLAPFGWETLHADHLRVWQDATRGYFWNDLARRARATADPALAEVALDSAERFVSLYRPRAPVWPEGTPTPYPTDWRRYPYTVIDWAPITAGIRAQDTLPGLLATALDQPAMTPARHALLVASLVEHARFLMDYETVGINWGIIEAGGLAGAALTHPEFAEAEAWRAEAERRALAIVAAQVLPDGGQYELSPHYHNVVARNLWLIASARRHLRPDLGPLAQVEQALERMIDWALRLQRPDGTEPLLGDSVGLLPQRAGFFADEWRDAGGLATGRAWFDRPDWDFWAGLPGAARPPADTWLASSGFAVVRSGWDPDALYLGLDLGMLGASHHTEDGLHLSLESHGHRWIVDSGRGDYGNTLARFEYFLNSAGHNTARPAGRSQARMVTQTRPQWSDPALHLAPRLELDRLWWAYARGIYARGYSPLPNERIAPDDGLPARLDEAEHWRGVFVERDARRVFVFDRLAHPEPVAWEVFWHFDAASVALLGDETAARSAWQLAPGATPALRGRRAGDRSPSPCWLQATFLSPEAGMAASWTRGQTDPYQGWIQDAWAAPRPAWAAVLRHAPATRVRQVAAFQPVGCPNDASDVTTYPEVNARGAAEAVAVQLHDPRRGRRSLVLFNPDRALVEVGDITTDAELAVLWIAGSSLAGPLFGWVAVDATHLAWKGEVLHASTERATAERGPSWSILVR